MAMRWFIAVSYDEDDTDIHGFGWTAADALEDAVAWSKGLASAGDFRVHECTETLFLAAFEQPTGHRWTEIDGIMDLVID